MKVRTVLIFIILLIFPNYIFAQMQRPSMTVMRRTGSFAIRKKPNKEQKQRLQPNAQDLAKYAQFLSQPKSGIFRLMPDLGCTENANVVRADAVCLQEIPESSFYSFREKEHTIEMLADIRLRNGYLISDAILSQSVLVNLGEIELEKVAPTSRGLEFLTGYTPNPLAPEAQKQFIEMMRGVKAGDYEYKKALPVIENTTYVLRAIAYKGSIVRSFRGWRYDVLEGDKRIDLTVAFRVIRKETDGGVTLLWKEIGRKDSPRIEFPKRKKK